MELSEVMACLQNAPKGNPDVEQLALLLQSRFETEEEMRHWLTNENHTLRGVPGEIISTKEGLSRVVGFVMMSGSGFF